MMQNSYDRYININFDLIEVDDEVVEVYQNRNNYIACLDKCVEEKCISHEVRDILVQNYDNYRNFAPFMTSFNGSNYGEVILRLIEFDYKDLMDEIKFGVNSIEEY